MHSVVKSHAILLYYTSACYDNGSDGKFFATSVREFLLFFSFFSKSKQISRQNASSTHGENINKQNNFVL